MLAGFSEDVFWAAGPSATVSLGCVIGLGCFSDFTKANSIALINSEAVAKREAGFFARRCARQRCRCSGNAVAFSGLTA